jgi:putative peptide zinc metalloprotease protein
MVMRTEIALPRLRDDAVIRRFDGHGSSAQHVVAIDGRHFVASEAVAALLELTRKSESLAGLAERMSARFGKPFSAHEIERVLREQIPAILFHAGQGELLRGPLHLRLRLLSAEMLRPILHATRGLFTPIVAIVLGALFLAGDCLVAVELSRHGLESFATASLPGAFALILAGIAVHELGHLSACHRYGASHGGLGIGLYWCLPAFYAEVHGAWLLTRTQRCVVDVAGIYFQCIFLGVIATAWLVRPSGTLLMVLWVSYFLVLNTLNPVLKYDGYWLLSDLSGSYNLHQRMRANARRCGSAMRRNAGAAWPRRADGLLLGLFATLAVAYFAYVFYFLAHNLAYAASRVVALNSGWQWLAAFLGMSLLIGFAVGTSLMLARAVEGAVGFEAQAAHEKNHVAR